MDRDAEAAQEKAHRLIAASLRMGLVLSAVLAVAVVAIGGTSLLDAGQPSVELDGRHATALASATLSLVVLAATPALRVVLLAALWARQRDWRFVLVALAVAGVLATCILLGRAG